MFIIESDFKSKYLVRTNHGAPKRITTLVNAVPKTPIYHHFTRDDVLGPEPTDLVVNAIAEADNDLAIYVKHITDLAIDNEKDKGYFGKKLTNDKLLVQEYHKRYRQFTRVFDIERVLKKNYPLIINYNMLPKLYPIKLRRPDTFKWVEDVWYDAMWSTAASLDTDRIQFVSIMAPRQLKPLSYYRDLLKYQRVTDLRKINNREDLILLDLFAYYTGVQDESIIGKHLPKCQNVTLAIRDDINVFYLEGAKLREWASEEGDEAKKLEWLYGLFEYLVSMRPVDLDEDNFTYDEHIQQVKEKAKQEIEAEAEDVTVSNISETVLDEANTLLEAGAITEGEYKGSLKLAARYQNLPNPIGDGKLVDVLNKPRDIRAVPKSTVPDMKAVKDKSVLDNKVKLLDESYIKNTFQQDMLRTVMQLQREGIIITGIRSEVIEDAAGKSQLLSVQTKPVKGDVATFKIEVPSIREDGTFKLGGVDYRMNKQRGELPIVKIADSTVALTSAMSKLFVERGRRRANSYPEWLYANLLNLKQGGFLTDVRVDSVYVSDEGLNIPDTYAILAMRFRTFKFKDITFNFDYKKRANLVKGNLKDVEKNGIIAGTVPGGYLLIDEANNFFTLKNGKEEVLGSIEDVLGLDRSRRPIEFSEVKVKGKYVPVGVMLAYWMGVEKFFKYIGVEVEEYEKNGRIPAGDGIVIRFKDVKLNINCQTKMQELLVGGFTYFKTALKDVNYDDLRRQSNFHSVFASRGIGQNQYNTFTRIKRLWIDPITHDLLEYMGEPTDITNLFIRATELLTNKQHVDETDGAYKINKGYNRINDLIYKELVNGVVELNRGSTTAKRTFSINPKAVRMAIAMDAGVSPVAEANPMQVSGEQERITYGGAGGRSNQSMMGRHRKFHKNDMGVISEGFTDNGKAGTILYYTANPDISSIYGTPGKSGKRDVGNLLSNSTVINPFSLKDDPKRSNFARIHFDAWANVVGQMTLPCRTGAELVMAHKAGKKFALSTVEAGRVVEVTDEGMRILYESGEEDTVKLGRSFGSNAGKTIPHKMITDRKVGYKFQAGEILAWNPYFFERDWIEDKQVAMLIGVPSFIALRETMITYEDGSSQSETYAKKLASRVTHIRDILVNFDDNVKLNTKVGDTLETDSSLANILPVGVEFTDDTSSLDYQSNTSPKSKYVGDVERIEVLYCGDPSEASESVRGIIAKGDRERKKESVYTKEYPRGDISEPTYIGKNFVGRNSCLIRIYITGLTSFEGGDKMGYMHALKTVSGKIYSHLYETVNGLPIDGDFSYKGVMARIVDSPVYEGIANMIVRQIGLNACKVYEGEMKP